MSTHSHLTGFYQVLTSNNSDNLHATEDSLMQLFNDKPIRFLKDVLQLLRDTRAPLHIKALAISCVTSFVRTHAEEPEFAYFTLMSLDQKHDFQQRLLQILSEIDKTEIAVEFAKALGHFAGIVVGEPYYEDWPGLVEHLAQLFESGSAGSARVVFQILCGLFSGDSRIYIENKSRLLPLLRSGVESKHAEVMSGCLSAVGKLVNFSKSQDVSELETLNLGLLQVVARLYELGEFQLVRTAVGCLHEICEVEPSFLKRRFAELLELVSVLRPIFNQDSLSQFKSQIVECLVMLVESCPEVVGLSTVQNDADDPLGPQKKLGLDAVLELILMNMVELPDRVDPHWASPLDGFDDRVSKHKGQTLYVREMDFIDRLLLGVGFENIREPLMRFTQKMIASKNWKFQTAALMALSQLGEHLINKHSETERILTLVKTFIEDEHPHLRFACCHVLGIFSHEQPNWFQNTFHAQFFEIISGRLADPVPRVRAHCLSSLSNFFGEATPNHVKHVFEHVYERIMHILTSDTIYVREASAIALGALSQCCSELFRKHYERTMEVLLGFLENENNPELWSLQGIVIEALTMMSVSIGSAQFEPFMPKFLESLVRIQSECAEHIYSDSRVGYLLDAFARLANILGTRLAGHFESIWPGLLRMMRASVDSIENYPNRVCVFHAQNAEHFVQLVSKLISEMGEQLRPYIREISDILERAADIDLEGDYKSMLIDCLIDLAGMIKAESQGAIESDAGTDQTAKFQNMVTVICGTLLEVIDQEEEIDHVAEHFDSFAKAIPHTEDLWTEADLARAYEICFEQLERCETREAKSRDYYNLQKEQEAGVDLELRELYEQNHRVREQIVEMLGCLFKTHKQSTLPMLHAVCDNFIWKAVDPEEPPKIIKLGVFLIDDAIDHLGQSIPAELRAKFYEVLRDNIASPNTLVRQAAAYGIGAFALCVEGQFADNFGEITQMLMDAREETETNGTEIKCEYTEENITAAIGKILKACWSKVPDPVVRPVLARWLEQMPLTVDAKEWLLQRDFFVEIAMSQSELLLGSSLGNLPRVLAAIARFVEKAKDDQSSTIKEMKRVLRCWDQNPKIRDAIKAAKLNAQEKLTIDNLILETSERNDQIITE